MFEQTRITCIHISMNNSNWRWTELLCLAILNHSWLMIEKHKAITQEKGKLFLKFEKKIANDWQGARVTNLWIAVKETEEF